MNPALDVAGDLSSRLELGYRAILVNNGSLNVYDATERSVRNGCHKKALRGSSGEGCNDG